ncbi:zinc finger protein 717-like [Scomber scombrus]|uniref:Zinc finger protein 717-like n=1 Tax=Scomber scombrus TaxID=13677 RepID=A0AAV1Q2E8_SCOSC
MASRPSFHDQLSSIIETMASSALTQVCTLVDKESSELRHELSRLLIANSALAEKVESLECELTIVRSDPPTLCKSYCTVGVQTICHRDGDDAPVSKSPTIEGIFGKDWCMDLWKDRYPYSLEKVTDSPLSSDKFDQIAVTDIKEEDYEEDAVSSCQEGILSTEQHRGCLAEEPERLVVGYSADGSTCSLSFDQDEEQTVSAGGLEEPSMQLISVNDTEEAFSTHIIPIKGMMWEDDDDVQFVEESHQEPTLNAASEPTQNKQQTVTANTENSTVLDKNPLNNFNVLKSKKNQTNSHVKYVTGHSFTSQTFATFVSTISHTRAR